MSEHVDAIVVGAGVVGCAVTASLADLGVEVALLESAAQEGTGLTSRNSGVVHSGLYYGTGSAKARLCVEGQAALYRWCEANEVAFQRCGKLVVGEGPEEKTALEWLEMNARENGARDIQLVGREEALALEPELANTNLERALWCPWTGIVDAHGLTASLRRRAMRTGAVVAFEAEVREAARKQGQWTLESSRGELRARAVVNATGLHADRLARLMGLHDYVHRYSRGDYVRWHGPRPFRRLVYPVRPKGSAGLGVHLTLELDGGVRFGPDAKWVDDPGDLTPDDAVIPAFHVLAERLVGPVDLDRMTWDGCGIRPKLFDRGGRPVDDFVVAHADDGAWHLLGVESPGLTASLALGHQVAQAVTRTLP